MSDLNKSLINAAIQGDDDRVASLLAQQADANCTDYLDRTPLHWAAIHGHTSTCQALIDKQDNIDACDFNKQTPLHIAAMYGRTSTCQALIIDYQADIDACDHENQTALHWAAIKGYTSTCQALIDNGADCTIRSLVRAFARGVKLLCNRSAWLRLTCAQTNQQQAGYAARYNNKTPLECALVNNKAETAQAIRAGTHPL